MDHCFHFLKMNMLAKTKGLELVLTCFGIVLGYMVVEVVNRYIWKPKRS